MGIPDLGQAGGKGQKMTGGKRTDGHKKSLDTI